MFISNLYNVQIINQNKTHTTMKTITAYKTTDGKVFESKETAEAYEKELKIEKDLFIILHSDLDYTETQAEKISADIVSKLDLFKEAITQ